MIILGIANEMRFCKEQQVEVLNGENTLRDVPSQYAPECYKVLT